VAGEEFGVFASEDVVGDGGDGVVVSEGEAEGQHEGCFSRADGAVISCICFSLDLRFREVGEIHPPMPTVKARSLKSLPSTMGSSRFRYEPGPSRVSWVCPWSAALCECPS